MNTMATAGTTSTMITMNIVKVYGKKMLATVVAQAVTEAAAEVTK